MKDEIKRFLAKRIKKLLIIVTIVVLALVSFASFFLGTTTGVHKNVSKIFNEVNDKVEIKDKNLVIDEDYLEQGKRKLRTMGINANSLGLSGYEDYLELFLEAEIVTSYPYLGGDGLQGTVYFERSQADGSTKQLKYMPYDEFYSTADVTDYFTVDTSDWTAHVKKSDGTIEKIDYKKMVSKFAMPFEFPIALSQVTQNPNFCLAVVKLVKKSRIVITIAESETVTVTQKKTKYNYSAETHNADGTTTQIAENQEVETDPTEETETSYSTSVFLSRAKTWIVNYSASAKYETSETDEPTLETSLDDIHDTQDAGDGSSYSADFTNRKEIRTGKRKYNKWQKGTSKITEKSERFTNLILRDKNTGSDELAEIAKQLHDYLSENQYYYSSKNNIDAGHYTGSDGPAISSRRPTIGEPMSERYLCCTTLSAWVLWTAGYKDVDFRSVDLLDDYCASKGWDVIEDYSELQPGDICFWGPPGGKAGHTNVLYELNGEGPHKYYDCGCTDWIRSSEPTEYSPHADREFLHAYRPNDDVIKQLNKPKNSDELENKIKELVKGMTDGNYSVSYKDSDGGTADASINGGRVTSDGWIKLYIMAVAFDEVKKGNIKLEDVESDIDTMIATDDGARANKILETLGKGDWQKGVDVVNEWLRKNSYGTTKITKSVEGESSTAGTTEGDKENYTSVANVKKLLNQIETGKLISNEYSEKMKTLLQGQLQTDMIPTQIDNGTVGNKTGIQASESSYIVQDAAIVSIDKANYVIAISAENVSSIDAAKENIKKIAKVVNDYFSEYGTLDNNDENEDSYNGDGIPVILNGKRVCYEMIDGRWICPLDNLVEGREILFKLLSSTEKTQSYEKLMRYLLYLLTGKSYGVTDFDFGEMFMPDTFVTASGGIIGNTAEEKVWWALINAGYSKEAAAGVMGNIYAECEFDSSLIEGGSGIGFGLCQWSFERRTQLERYAASKGVDPSDVNTQIEFLLGELTPGGGANGFATYQLINGQGYTVDSWKHASTPEEAAQAFCWLFERPGIPRMNVRTEAARRYYEQFKDASMPTGGAAGVGAQGALERAKLCEQYVNKYDWNRNYYPDPNNMSTWTMTCSGLVNYCYGLAGPNGGDAKWRRCEEWLVVLRSQPNWTSNVNQLSPGDVICWAGHGRSCGHVAIYAGNGQCYEAMPGGGMGHAGVRLDPLWSGGSYSILGGATPPEAK